MNITLRQIEAFLAVAQLEGFTRAAERIHLTQSAISVLIRELEDQIGARLFDRTTRAVRLTAVRLISVSAHFIGSMKNWRALR